MTNRRRKGKVYRGPSKATTVDPVTAAIRRAEALSASDVGVQRGIGAAALAALAEGAASTVMGGQQVQHDACLQHWRSLADIANMAETLAGMGLGGGPDANAVITESQQALADILQRRSTSQHWATTEPERDALGWLLRLHCDIQIPATSYGEYERAFQKTRNRVQQAAAGNAGRGTVVVIGDFAGASA